MASYKYDGGQSDVPAKPKTPAKTESKAATPAKATAAQVSMNKAATANSNNLIKEGNFQRGPLVRRNPGELSGTVFTSATKL